MSQKHDIVVGKIEQLTDPDSGILFIRKHAMNKSKGHQESNISVSEWMEAEARVRGARTQPQPGGSVTTEQYAQIRGICKKHAQAILRSLFMAGEARRENWRSGGAVKMVYWLVKKK
jgi:hypothetical protein